MQGCVSKWNSRVHQNGTLHRTAQNITKHHKTSQDCTGLHSLAYFGTLHTLALARRLHLAGWTPGDKVVGDKVEWHTDCMRDKVMKSSDRYKLLPVGTRVYIRNGNGEVPAVIAGTSTFIPRWSKDVPEVFYIVDIRGEYLESRTAYVTMLVVHPDNVVEDRS